MRFRELFLSLVVCVILLSACATPAPAPSPAPTPTPATEHTPAPTPTPLLTPAPALPPLPTPTPVPTPAPAPAAFQISRLSVTPTEAKPGEKVTITAEVSNTGETEGTHTVELKVNDDPAAKETIAIASGASKVVTFTLSRDSPGIYKVSVDGACQEFTVKRSTSIIMGIAFCDFNGNGIYEADEPLVQGVKLEFASIADEEWYTVETDAFGQYYLELPVDRYALHIIVKGVTGHNGQLYRYLSVSESEFRPLYSPIDIDVKPNARFDIALMQGYLTLPFPKGTRETHERSYVSIRVDSGTARDWRGLPHQRSDHLGRDFMIPTGTPILAAAPGIVAESRWSDDDGNLISIRHPDGNLTIYCHLSERNVLPGDRVSRGDKIGASGNTGRLTGPNPHLHFQFGGFGLARIDPYRDVKVSGSVNYWTKDNDPQFPSRQTIQDFLGPDARKLYTFKDIVPLLNTPDKVSAFMKNNIKWDGKYDIETAGGNEYVPAWVVYERGIDDCDGHATLQAYLLKANGYDAFNVGIGIEGPEGHGVCTYKENGQWYVLGNCGAQEGPFESLDSLADYYIKKGWANLGASIILFDPFDITSPTRDPFSLPHTFYKRRQ